MQANSLSKCGKPKFECDGFLYIFDRFSADKETKFYRCERKDSCKARIHVRNEEIVKYINDHSHSPSPANVEREKVLSQIKERACETVEGTSIVINECLENVSQACQGAMPNNRALKKMVHRKRKQLASYPGNPIDLASLFIPDEFKT